MKKVFMSTALILLLGTLSGCCIQHEWQSATCTEPETCSKCGKTNGEALGHTWEDATCDTPKTCVVCGATEGDALGHVWTEATCTTPQVCSVCAAIGEEELGHDYIYNDIIDNFVCSRCNEAKIFKNGELDEIANMMISDYGRFKDLYEDRYITAEISVDLWYTDDPAEEIVVDLYNVEDGGCLAYFKPSAAQKEEFSKVIDDGNYRLVVRGKLTGAYHVLADQYSMHFSYSEIISYGWENEQ